MITLLQRKQSIILLCIVLCAGALISFGIMANAQEHDSLLDVVYPVIELGGCENEVECMTYCEEIGHINECITFAEEHDLLSPEEIAEARKFAAAGGVGPGGCTSRESCEAYCTDITHIDECILFGEKHGLIPPEELAEAKKIAKALAEGAELPGGCTSKDTCEAYCSDSLHIEECIAFAEAAGFMEGEELEEAKKFMEFIKTGGQTPGGCRGEHECMNYCENPDHFSECVAFAEELGFISPEEAEMARKTGGKGPGGCVREACEAYCNDPTHQEECFAFAKEHGLVSDEDLEHAQRGFNDLREGLSQAPEEVRVCIKDSLGADLFAKLEAGEPFTPSSSFGEKIRHCFESLGPSPDEIINIVDQAPSAVRACIEERLGADVQERLRTEGITALKSDAGNAIRNCFGEFGGSGEFNGHDGSNGGGFKGPSYDTFSETPPAVLGCLSTELGYERFVELRDEDTPFSPEDKEALMRCFEQSGIQKPDAFPDVYKGETPHEGFEGSTNGFPEGGSLLPPLPPGIKECLFVKLGNDFEEKLFTGELDPSSIEPAIRACTEEYIQSQTTQEFETHGEFIQPEEGNTSEPIFNQEQPPTGEGGEQPQSDDVQQIEGETHSNLRAFLGNTWNAFIGLFR